MAKEKVCPDADYSVLEWQGRVFKSMGGGSVSPGGRRGVVKCFSAQSRHSMLDRVNRIDWTQAGCVWFVTLTVPDEAWVDIKTMQEWTRCFWERLRSKWASRWGIWRFDLHEDRGEILHCHNVIGNWLTVPACEVYTWPELWERVKAFKGFPEQCERRLAWAQARGATIGEGWAIAQGGFLTPSIQEVWRDIIGCGRLPMCDVSYIPCVDVDKVVAYVGQYISKNSGVSEAAEAMGKEAERVYRERHSYAERERVGKYVAARDSVFREHARDYLVGGLRRLERLGIDLPKLSAFALGSVSGEGLFGGRWWGVQGRKHVPWAVRKVYLVPRTGWVRMVREVVGVVLGWRVGHPQFGSMYGFRALLPATGDLTSEGRVSCEELIHYVVEHWARQEEWFCNRGSTLQEVCV